MNRILPLVQDLSKSKDIGYLYCNQFRLDAIFKTVQDLIVDFQARTVVPEHDGKVKQLFLHCHVLPLYLIN